MKRPSCSAPTSRSWARCSALLEDNPLPASYAVTISAPMRSERVLEQLTDELGALPGVEGAQYDLEIIGRLELGVRALRLLGVLLGGTVLLAAVVTTANVIRVMVFARRREIETMRLVGASEAVVVGRFLMEGGLQGLLAGVLAIGILGAAYSFGLAYLDPDSLGFLSLLPLRFPAPGDDRGRPRRRRGHRSDRLLAGIRARRRPFRLT